MLKNKRSKVLLLVGTIFVILCISFFSFNNTNSHRITDQKIPGFSNMLFEKELNKKQNLIFYKSTSSTIGIVLLEKRLFNNKVILYSSGASLSNEKPLTYGYGETMIDDNITSVYYGIINQKNIEKVEVNNEKATIIKSSNNIYWYLLTNEDYEEVPLTIKGFTQNGEEIYTHPSNSSLLDPLLSKQLYMDTFEISSINSQYSFPKEIKVALLDSGVDVSHSDLKGVILEGYDFIENDSVPNDLIGHGTKMAGIIGAIKNNGVGIAGIASNVKIIPIKIIGQDNTSLDLMIKGINYAIKKK